MKKSYKVIRNSFLYGFLGGALFTIVVLYLGSRETQTIRWSKLPSPAEDIDAILQVDTVSEGVCGFLAAKSGNIYSCLENGEACKQIDTLSQDEMASFDLCKDYQINVNDDDFHAPRKQAGQIIDTCEAAGGISEVPTTFLFLLYSDNSLWLGKSGGPGFIPMYGAGYFFFCIFFIGGMVVFFIAYAILSSREKFKKQQDVDSSIST